MIESNDIWSVMAYIWNWMSTTVWYQGEIFGVSVHFTILLLWIFPLIGAFFIWIIKLVLDLVYG